MKRIDWSLFVAIAIIGVCVAGFFAWVWRMHNAKEARELELRHGRCYDESVLFATTAGSPDRFRCPNDRHRMRVEVATRSSPEEAAALVFCECVRASMDGGAE